MPMTDSNWPAIDDSAVSSTTDELRATSELVVAVGPVEGLAHGGVVGDVGAGVDGVGERGGQHDAGQGREARRCGRAGERGLAAGERGVAARPRRRS